MSKTIPVFAATVCAVTLSLALLVTSMSIRAQPAHATATTCTHTDLGTLADVGTAPGNTIARGVNTSGQVVGHSLQRLEDGRLQLRAFYWDGGPMLDLGTLGGPNSAARGINDSGQLVGFARTAPTGNQQRAFVTEKDAQGRTPRCSRLPPVPRSTERSEGHAILMRSEEAGVGKRVRVVEDHSAPHLRKLEGTVVKRWGNPCHAALHVLLDEGRWELFWYHELEEIDEIERDLRPRDG